MMALAAYRPRLKNAAEQLDISLSTEQQDKLLLYVEQLERWNRTYNLTAIRDIEQMFIQHIFDSLAVFPIVHRILDKNTVQGGVIVDVGSGGGLPGIVLAIAAPWTVHCVDSVQKKMAFVRQMSGVLDLPNLQAHHARIEKLEPFDADIVISRAFSSLVDFVCLAGNHIKNDGYLLAMKGHKPEDEIIALEAETPWRVDSIETLSVPELDAQRCVLRLSREGSL